MKSDLNEIISEIKRFRDERDWKQFHDSKNLAISLNIEAAHQSVWGRKHENTYY